MKGEYIIEPQVVGKTNSYIQEISFVENDFLASVSLDDENKAELLSQRMYALRGIADTDVTADKKQNFEITLRGKNVILNGNLFNAFNILVDNQLITKEFRAEMMKHPAISMILERSKACSGKEQFAVQSESVITDPRKNCSLL